MFLSVTCAESYGLMDFAQASALSRKTWFGDYRLRRQRDACAHWPIGTVSSSHLDPIRSDAAILLLSGEHDPVTPLDLAASVAGEMSRARHIVIPAGGHLYDGLRGLEACLDPLILDFLAHAESARLDDRCVSGIVPPPFRTGPD